MPKLCFEYCFPLQGPGAAQLQENESMLCFFYKGRPALISSKEKLVSRPRVGDAVSSLGSLYLFGGVCVSGIDIFMESPLH